ncbi:MAG: hypothetical protein V1753_00350, partial [Pseudomonadota bacterium]
MVRTVWNKFLAIFAVTYISFGFLEPIAFAEGVPPAASTTATIRAIGLGEIHSGEGTTTARDAALKYALRSAG